MQVCSSDGIEASEPDNTQPGVRPCVPSAIMHTNVSFSSAIVSLHPSLKYPDVQNIRVEVAGQVLSQGGNVGADQLADTSDIITQR